MDKQTQTDCYSFGSLYLLVFLVYLSLLHIGLSVFCSMGGKKRNVNFGLMTNRGSHFPHCLCGVNTIVQPNMVVLKIYLLIILIRKDIRIRKATSTRFDVLNLPSSNR